MKKSTAIIISLTATCLIVMVIMLGDRPGYTPETASQTDTESVFRSEAQPTGTQIIDTESGEVVATINDIDIHQLDLLPYIYELIPAKQKHSLDSFDDLDTQLIDIAVRNIAIDILMEQRAQQNAVADDPRLQAILQQNRRRYIRAAYMDTLAEKLVEEDEVRQMYDELVASLQDKQEYRARHILLASEKEAEIIYKALSQKKKTFSELAKLFSLDDATSYKGGDLGYQPAGRLNASFESAVNLLALHQHSKPFETELGWHIALVDDRRDSQPITFEQAEPLIRKNLQRSAADAYTQQLLAEASIDINHEKAE